MALLSATRNATKEAIQPADKIANCEIDCVLLLPVALVSMNVKDSRKRIIVAASVAAPNTSSDLFLSVDPVCCSGDDDDVVVTVIQSECTSPILANFQTTTGSKMATGKIDRNVVLHPEYSAIVAPINNPRIEPLANIEVITPWPMARRLFGNCSLITLNAIGNIDMPTPCMPLAMIKLERSVVRPPTATPIAYTPITMRSIFLFP